MCDKNEIFTSHGSFKLLKFIKILVFKFYPMIKKNHNIGGERNFLNKFPPDKQCLNPHKIGDVPLGLEEDQRWP
jgi:hypothetical protein